MWLLSVATVCAILPTQCLTRSIINSNSYVDIVASKDVRYRHVQLDYEDTDFNFNNFIASWVALVEDVGSNVTDRVLTPFGIFNFQASNDGLMECEIELPSILRQSTVFVSLSYKVATSQSSVERTLQFSQRLLLLLEQSLIFMMMTF
jgi:hypothetical protein